MKFLLAFACLLAVAAAGYVAPVTYSHAAVGAAVVAPAVVPYAHGTYLYRARRQIPVAYSGVAAVHTPGYAYSTYGYPYAHAALYRKRRQVAYAGYAHAPVVAHSAYAYPYAAHSAYLYRKRRDLVVPAYAGAGYGHAAYSYGAYPYGQYSHYY